MIPWCAQAGAASWLATIAVWVVIVALVAWGLGRMFPVRSDADARAADARSILDTRLAAGEIDVETYRAVRTQIDADPAAAMKGSR
ncbi:hypothetical protein [Cellulomonas hominis]